MCLGTKEKRVNPIWIRSAKQKARENLSQMRFTSSLSMMPKAVAMRMKDESCKSVYPFSIRLM